MTQRLRNWCFTAFSDPASVPFAKLRNVRYCVYQHELCPTTAQDHWQGYIEFTEPMRLEAVKRIFDDRTLHLEVRRGTRDQARAYCMKEDTRFPGDEPIEYGDWERSQGERVDLDAARTLLKKHKKWSDVLDDPDLTKVCARHGKWARDIFENRPLDYESPALELYDWEKEALTVLEGKPVKRQVLWIWSAESATGKSTFFDYCSGKWNVLPANDYVNTIYSYDANDIIWFDLSRAQAGLDIPYLAIEKLSNGGFHLSTKYVPCRKLIQCHIVVTCNAAPDESRLPERCKVIQAEKPPARPATPPSPDIFQDWQDDS